jgi:hypothetical protein
MARPLKDYVCAALGITIGIFCQQATAKVTAKWMKPIVEQCTQGDLGDQERIVLFGLHPYESSLGGSFICIITQFLHSLATEYPAGLLAWGSVILVSLPFALIGGIEPGRAGAKGPVRYPVIIGLLAQLLGACVVIPAIWIPAYIFGGSREGGAFHSSRPFWSIVAYLPAIFLTLALFLINPDSQLWSICAAILGGPLMAFLAFSLVAPPTDTKEMEKHEKPAIASLVKGYDLFTVLSLIAWVILVFHAVKTYGLNVFALYDGIWGEAHPSVKFMTIDALGFLSAIFIYVYLRSPSHLWKVLMLTPLVGPGAAVCHVLKETEQKYYYGKRDHRLHII